jgi:hypothetical protein
LAKDICPVKTDDPATTDSYSKDWQINDQPLKLWVKKLPAV